LASTEINWLPGLGTGWEPTPWRATQPAALKRTEAGSD
jgi:hypothetical protein